jgi:hypothetical protein
VSSSSLEAKGRQAAALYEEGVFLLTIAKRLQSTPRTISRLIKENLGEARFKEIYLHNKRGAATRAAQTRTTRAQKRRSDPPAASIHWLYRKNWSG